MFLPHLYRSSQPAQSTEHSQIAAAKNPNLRFDVRELFSELERDYGPDGAGMTFGSILIPLYREARTYIPSGTQITVSQFNEILRATSNFSFVDKAVKDRRAAISDIVQSAKRLGAIS